MTLRVRLVIVAAAAVAVAVALASVLVYFLVRNELRGQVDRNLKTVAAQVNDVPRFLAFNYAPGVYALEVRGPLFGGYFQLVDTDGNVYIPQTFVRPTPELPVTKEVLAVAAGGIL